MARIGLVLGAGGIVGGAFHDGVLRALTEATGWDPRDAEVIVGTSIGSYAGAMLRGSGQTGRRAPNRARRPAAIAGDERARGRYAPAAPGVALRALTRPGSVRPGAALSGLLPAGRTSFAGLGAEVDRVHAGGWPERPLWLPAVRLRDGQRVVFGTDDAPPASVGDAVAASCAIPGYATPVVIGGERYIDGGAHSTTNADLVAGLGLDLVIVSAPMGQARGAWSASSVLQGRGYMRWRLAAEARAVRRSGAAVIAFSPTPADLQVMGWNAMAAGRRSAVVERAYESARERLERSRWREMLAPLTATH